MDSHLHHAQDDTKDEELGKAVMPYEDVTAGVGASPVPKPGDAPVVALVVVAHG